MSSQLFHVLPPISLPHSGVKHKDGTHVSTEIIPAFPFMYWPSGKPCEPVNMYLLDIAHEATGDSLRTYASELSHLVRYCGNKQRGIESLTDADMTELSKQLQEEKAPRNPLEHIRNNNTVRTILSRTIRFLFWYEKEFMLVLRTPLIGEHVVSPQINVTRTKSEYSNRRGRKIEYAYAHAAMPPDVSREPKHPIALSVIDDIRRVVYGQSTLEKQKARFVQRYRSNPSWLEAQLEYVRARRLFMIWMMMHTGLRPSELVAMGVGEHANIITTRTLKIPTKKRRKITAPIRNFPILLNAATVVHRYLFARKAYCETLKALGKDLKPGDSFFLRIDGMPIKAASLEKDFERLAEDAGYKDVQVCLSMFRHRFITLEVTAHLTEFMEQSKKSRQMMTDIDYESILKRVAVKTGHGSVESLWHYIDLAWNEMGVWGSVDQAIARLHAADQLFDDLLALQHEAGTLSNRQGDRMVDLNRITSRLGEILSNAKQALEGGEPHRKALETSYVAGE